MHTRRLLAAMPLALALPLLLVPGRSGATVRQPVEPRRLRLRHVTTGTGFAGPYHNGVAHDPGALAELSLVLADSRTGASRPFDPAALDILWEVARRTGLGGQELPILSGYRTPQTNAAVDGAEHSQHLRAGAVDVLLRPASFAGVAAAALLLGRGGVGLYARRSFIHLDSGPVRQWTDGPSAGPTAVAATPPQDRLSRMADAWAATRGR